MVWHVSLKYLLEWLVAAQLVDKYGEVDPVIQHQGEGAGRNAPVEY
ncbi:hypothetical protein FOCG_15090 [Fusarium oxysporum f. sp. radicis-lycopersici 26381]|nr:hypothetical protein FOCG_15090 [Fusarium oxysporum f. sp. radicis-lycopersici 26381]